VFKWNRQRTKGGSQLRSLAKRRSILQSEFTIDITHLTRRGNRHGDAYIRLKSLKPLAFTWERIVDFLGEVHDVCGLCS